MTNEGEKIVHLFFSRYITRTNMGEDIKSVIDSDELEREIVLCDSWSSLPHKLLLRPRSICFHISELEFTSALEIVGMIDTMHKLVCIHEKDPIIITVSITRLTPLSTIKDLQQSGILGIIPNSTDWSLEETIRGLKAQWSGIPYWPANIISQLPGNEVRKPKSTNIHLTPRQSQILRMISETGSSNKIIARKLKISESTVKLHVTGLLKKFGVRNRTQLALFSDRAHTGV